jgi:hypothetical protein
MSWNVNPCMWLELWHNGSVTHYIKVRCWITRTLDYGGNMSHNNESQEGDLHSIQLIKVSIVVRHWLSGLVLVEFY